MSVRQRQATRTDRRVIHGSEIYKLVQLGSRINEATTILKTIKKKLELPNIKDIVSMHECQYNRCIDSVF